MSTASDTGRSPAEQRATRAVEPRPVAWWGMVLTLLVVVTSYAALYFSYVYIRVGVERWPPPGTPPPPLDLAAPSVGALLLGAAVLGVALRRSAALGSGMERTGLVVATTLGTVHVVLLYADWQRAPFAVTDHSYAALFYVLPQIHAVVVGLALVMAVVHLLLSFRPQDLPRRAVGLQGLATYWSTVAIAGTLLLAVVYLLPHAWPVR